SYYTYRINSAAVLAMLVPDVDRREQLLYQVIEDAKSALALDPPEPEYYYTAKGNALENLAWFGGRVDLYADALIAFESARSKNPGAARYLIGLGRCKFRVAETEGAKPRPEHKNYLADAIDLLTKAVQG